MKLIRFDDITIDVDDILYAAPDKIYEGSLNIMFKTSDKVQVILSVVGSKEFNSWVDIMGGRSS